MDVRFVLIMVIMLVGAETMSQSAILEDYVSRATENNLMLRDLRLKSQKQAIRVDQVATLWKPTVDADASYLFAIGGREIIFPVGDLFNPTHGALNQILGSQEFPTDLENVTTQLTPNNFLDASISISQPIINGAIKYNHQIQKALKGLADEDVAIAQNEITRQVRLAYYNHLKTYSALEVVRENAKLLGEVRAFNQKLVDYDKATIEVISDVDYQLAELRSQAAEIEEQRNVTRSVLNLLTLQELTEEIVIDTSLLADEVDQEEILLYTYVDALSSRGEYRKIEQGKEILLLNDKLISSQGKPVLGIKGGIGVQSEAFSFDSGGPLYTLGVGMSMNIFDGGMRKKKMEELSIDSNILDNQNEQLNQSISLELIRAQERMRSLNSKMSADQAAYNSAKQSFELIKVKYENEKALLIELLQARNRMATSQIRKIITKYDIYIQEAEIKYIIGR